MVPERVKLGLGLLGIRERVAMNQGQINLNSSNNHGLNIEIMIPIQMRALN